MIGACPFPELPIYAAVFTIFRLYLDDNDSV